MGAQSDFISEQFVPSERHKAQQRAMEETVRMAKKTTPRVIPANHFIADSLEEEANRLPPSAKANADAYREAARLYRALRTSKLVRVWEEKEDVNQAAARIVKETTDRS
jgi:hypothetical protein